MLIRGSRFGNRSGDAALRSVLEKTFQKRTVAEVYRERGIAATPLPGAPEFVTNVDGAANPEQIPRHVIV